MFCSIQDDTYIGIKHIYIYIYILNLWLMCQCVSLDICYCGILMIDIFNLLQACVSYC